MRVCWDIGANGFRLLAVQGSHFSANRIVFGDFSQLRIDLLRSAK
jgi:hypothetical protein